MSEWFGTDDDELPNCYVDDCDRGARKVKEITTRGYETTLSACHAHADDELPWGPYGANLAFETRRLTESDRRVLPPAVDKPEVSR